MILTAAVCMALTMTVGKIASTKVLKLNYMFISYSLAFLFTSAARKFIIPSPKRPVGFGFAALGAAAGVLNFLGYWLVLTAWSRGPLSLIQAILSTTMVITIILAAIFYGEKFTPRNVLAIILSLTAVLLIKG